MLEDLSDFKEKMNLRQSEYCESGFVRSLQKQLNERNTKSKEIFLDSIFPSNDLSVYSNKEKFTFDKNIPKFLREIINKKLGAKNNYIGKKYEWIRLSELYEKGTYWILKNRLQNKYSKETFRDDICDSHIGNKSFSWVLTIFSENADHILSIFNKKHLEKDNIFEINLYIHGERTIIIIDDFIPCLEIAEGKFEYAFSSINKKSMNIWPILLEKVWGKINLTYQNSLNSLPSEIFHVFSPAPYQSLKHSNYNAEKILELIENALKNSKIISACNIDNTKNFSFLDGSEVYNIISSYNFNDISGNVNFLIKLKNERNGLIEWTGDWSMKSSKWTEELKKLVNFNSEETDCFFMHLNDYMTFFTHTEIFFYNPNFTYNSNKFNFNPNLYYNLISIKIEAQAKTEKGYIILNQKNTKIYKNSKGLTDFKNLFCSAILFEKISETSFKFIEAKASRDDRIYFETELKKGTFIIALFYPKSEKPCEYTQFMNNYSSSFNQNINFSVGVYGKFTSTVIKPYSDKDTDSLFFIENYIFNGIGLEDKYDFSKEKEPNSWRGIFYNEAKSLGCICYENYSSAYIYENLTFTQIEETNIYPLILKNIDLKDKKANFVEEDTKNEFLSKLEDISMNEIFSINEEFNHLIKISKKNKLSIKLKVPPMSRFALILEKYEDNPFIDFDSQLVLKYPYKSLLFDKQFEISKKRIKHKINDMELYETLYQSNTDVLYRFKNKTKNLVLTVNGQFKLLRNLNFFLIYEENMIKNPELSTSFKIEIKPGKFGLIGLRSVNHFDGFSFEKDFEYHIKST